MLSNNPSVSFADSSPYTGEPTAAAGLLNGKSLYGTTRLAGGFRFTNNKKTRRIFVSFLFYMSHSPKSKIFKHLIALPCSYSLTSPKAKNDPFCEQIRTRCPIGKSTRIFF